MCNVLNVNRPKLLPQSPSKLIGIVCLRIDSSILNSTSFNPLRIVSFHNNPLNVRVIFDRNYVENKKTFIKDDSRSVVCSVSLHKIHLPKQVRDKLNKRL